MATQAVSWPGIPMVACSRPSGSKSCDLSSAFAPCKRGAQGVLPCVGWGVKASQLVQQSLTPLHIAGCGRLQLGAPHWTTSVALLQVVDN